MVLNLARNSPEKIGQLVGLIACVAPSSPPPQPARGTPAAGRARRGVLVRSDAGQVAELVARVGDGDLMIHVAVREPLTGVAIVHDKAVAASWLTRLS